MNTIKYFFEGLDDGAIATCFYIPGIVLLAGLWWAALVIEINKINKIFEAKRERYFENKMSNQ